MAATHFFDAARTSGSVFGTAFAVLANCALSVARALKNRKDATLLAGMDDRMLADIGLTRSDLRDAYAEPLWRDPTDILAGRARDKRLHRQPNSKALHARSPSIAPQAWFETRPAGRRKTV